MNGLKALYGIRMQNTRVRNPSVEERGEPLPTHIAALTAMDQYGPPQSSQPVPEDPQLRQVSRNSMIAVITGHDLLQPFTYCRWRLVLTADQFGLDCQQLRRHPLLCRCAPYSKGSIFPALPAVMRETQKGKGLRFSLSTPLPVLGGEPPKLDQSGLLGL